MDLSLDFLCDYPIESNAGMARVTQRKGQNQGLAVE